MGRGRPGKRKEDEPKDISSIIEWFILSLFLYYSQDILKNETGKIKWINLFKGQPQRSFHIIRVIVLLLNLLYLK